MMKLTLSTFIIVIFSFNAYAQVCTRSNTPQSISPANFDLSVGGEAKDKLTSLIWRRCVFGQNWNGTQCVGLPTKVTWSQALQHADVLGAGWRVPNIKELNSVMDLQCISPPVNLAIFPATPASQENGLWSSTPNVNEDNLETNAWYVEMHMGKNNYRPITTANFVRFVKDGN